VWLSQYQREILIGLLVLLCVGIFIGIIVTLLRRYRVWAVLGLTTVGVMIWMLVPYITTVAQILVVGVALTILVSVMVLLYKRFSFWGILLFMVITPLLWFARVYVWTFFVWLTIALLWVVQLLATIFGYIGRFFSWLGQYFVWLVEVVAFLFGLVLMFLTYLFFALIGIGAVAMLGNLLLDDIRAAWNSGTGVKGSSQGAFAVGLAVSLLLAVSLGDVQSAEVVNLTWNAIVPTALQFDVMGTYMLLLAPPWDLRLPMVFATAGIPLFDAFLLAVVILIGVLGALRGLRYGTTYEDSFSVRFFSEEAFWLIIGPPLVVLSAVAIANAPSDEG
jgi:hypothetical protein